MTDEFDQDIPEHRRRNLAQVAQSQAEIAERAAARQVQDKLRLIGISLAEQEEVNRLRDDLRWVRNTRMAAEARGIEIGKSLTGSLIGGLIGALGSTFAWFLHGNLK